jgi:hypothetical protein
MQHRFAIKVAIDEALHNRGDSRPARPRSPPRAAPDAAALDAHLFVEQHETGAPVRQSLSSSIAFSLSSQRQLFDARYIRPHFRKGLMPVVKDRMKSWLASGGEVPENLW